MSVSVNFFDPEVQACPYEHYQALHDGAPVYQDPMTGIYHVSRFQDVRHILATTNCSRERKPRTKTLTPRQQKVNERFQERMGPFSNVDCTRRTQPQTDASDVQEAFRPAKINDLDLLFKVPPRTFSQKSLKLESATGFQPCQFLSHSRLSSSKWGRSSDLWKIKPGPTLLQTHQHDAH